MENKILLIAHYENRLEPDKKEQVEAWLSESKQNREEYRDLVKIWERSKPAGLLNNTDIEKEWGLILKRYVPRAKPVEPLSMVYKIAASVIFNTSRVWQPVSVNLSVVSSAIINDYRLNT